MKNLLPPTIKIQLRIFFIFAKDVFSLRKFHFAKKVKSPSPLPRRLSLSQPIKKNNFSENKKHNLRLATQEIENVEIFPQQIFSYWQFIPSPKPSNGFKQGRNIIGKKLEIDYGGGLCQLSGLLYMVALRAGLEILERHPHSLDIYTAATRYTPLGSDATVVYGHKDLRFKNNLGFPIAFQFEILEHEIRIHLCASKPIESWELDFLVEEKKDGKRVEVFRQLGGKREKCSAGFYQNLEA